MINLISYILPINFFNFHSKFDIFFFFNYSIIFQKSLFRIILLISLQMSITAFSPLIWCIIPRLPSNKVIFDTVYSSLRWEKSSNGIHLVCSWWSLLCHHLFELRVLQWYRPKKIYLNDNYSVLNLRRIVFVMIGSSRFQVGKSTAQPVEDNLIRNL